MDLPARGLCSPPFFPEGVTSNPAPGNPGLTPKAVAVGCFCHGQASEGLIGALARTWRFSPRCQPETVTADEAPPAEGFLFWTPWDSGMEEGVGWNFRIGQAPRKPLGS